MKRLQDIVVQWVAGLWDSVAPMGRESRISERERVWTEIRCWRSVGARLEGVLPQVEIRPGAVDFFGSSGWYGKKNGKMFCWFGFKPYLCIAFKKKGA